MPIATSFDVLCAFSLAVIVNNYIGLLNFVILIAKFIG